MITLALMFITIGLVIAFGVSLVVAVVKWRPLPRTWAGMLAVLAAVVITQSELGGPQMEDGPFRGRPRADCPTRAPDQTLELAGGRRLEAFDAAPGDRAATVRLRRRDGGTQWCIYAIGKRLRLRRQAGALRRIHALAAGRLSRGRQRPVDVRRGAGLVDAGGVRRAPRLLLFVVTPPVSRAHAALTAGLFSKGRCG